MKYDVCFSFAGEDREYVEQVAHHVRNHGISVFYDKYNQVELWGKDLYTHLDEIYRKTSRYCVMFVSSYYANKLWTNHERRSCQAKAFMENSEYILPARFDDTDIPGILPTIGYIDLRELSPEQFASMIEQKVFPLNSNYELESNESNCDISFFSDDLSFPDIQWPTNSTVGVDSTFQLIPYTYESTVINQRITYILDSLISKYSKENNCWTDYQDRLFDRIHATTSVLSCFFQIGLPDTLSCVKDALRFLDSNNDISLENRANIFFNIAFHRSDEQTIVSFIRLLKQYQFSNKKSPFYGSFLLPQGPHISNDMGNWQQQRFHKDGASFHACNIADNLLHIQTDYLQARSEAREVLDGIRKYFYNSFCSYSGFLPNLESQPSNITLFGYALTRPLHISLPQNWLECVDYCLHNLSACDNPLEISFGVMNLYYLCRLNSNVELKQMAQEFVQAKIDYLWSKRDELSNNVRNLSILGRAFVYGFRLLNYDASAYILNTVYHYKEGSQL